MSAHRSLLPTRLFRVHRVHRVHWVRLLVLLLLLHPILSLRLLPRLPLLAPVAQAATPDKWPRQAIRLVVPWPQDEIADPLAGPLAGPLAIPLASASAAPLAESLAAALSRQIGLPVLLDHRPGLNGALAAEIVANASPDGHTFLLGSGEQLLACLLQARQLQQLGRPNRLQWLPPPRQPHQTGPGCNLQEDLAPVTLLAFSGSVLVVANRPEKPGSFAALLGERPAGAVDPGRSYASAGNGSLSHLAAEYLGLTSGMAIEHRPHPDLLAGLADLRGGKVDFMIVPLEAAQPGIRDGSLRALAVTSGSRSFALPAVPHLGEAGVPGMQVQDWQALWSPRETPVAIRVAMQEAVAAVLEQKELVDAWNGRGAERGGQPARVMELLVHSESLKWTRTIDALDAGRRQ